MGDEEWRVKRWRDGWKWTGGEHGTSCCGSVPVLLDIITVTAQRLELRTTADT